MRTKVRDDLLMETVKQALESHFEEGDYDGAMMYCQKLMDIAIEIGEKVMKAVAEQFVEEIFIEEEKS